MFICVLEREFVDVFLQKYLLKMSVFGLYILLIFIIFLVDGLKKKGYSNRFGNRIIFIALLLFSMLRYDITRDYFNYVKMFTEVRAGAYDVSELGFVYINKLFSFTKFGFLYVFALCSFVCIYAFQKAFERLGVVEWGWFFSITMLVVLMMNNQIRQAVSMSIFTLLIPYMEKGKLFKFSILMLLAISIHFSSIICFAFYFLFRFFKHYNPTREIWLILLLTSFGFYLSGFFYDVNLGLFKLFPQYAHYLDRDFFSSKDEIESGLGIVLMLFLAIILVFSKHKVDKKYIPYFNMAILYFILFIVFSDLRVIQRVAKYLFVFVTVAFAQVMISRKVADYYKYVLFFSVLIWFGRYGYLTDRPYYSMFSGRCEGGVFFDREDELRKAERDLKKSFVYDYEPTQERMSSSRLKLLGKKNRSYRADDED